MELSDKSNKFLQAIKYEINPEKLEVFNDKEIIEAALEYFYYKLIDHEKMEDKKHIKI